MMSVEQWAPVPGFPGYEVSDQGRVRSLKVWRGRPGPRFLTGTPEGSGYLQVSLMGVRGDQKQAVHRLVALAFRGPRPPGLEVRHLDGDQRNNRLTNLVYGTPLENAADARLHGRNRNRAKSHCHVGHAFDDANTYWKPSGARACKACRRVRERAYHARVRARQLAVSS